MSRYRVIHKISGEVWEVDAPFADDARRMVGWPMGICRILLLRIGPFAELIPPKVAVQLTPPKTGSAQICPDCHVTMVEKSGQEFWWECPSCDMIYHEWDNQSFSKDELDL